MSYIEEYRQKLIPKSEVINLVKDNDRIVCHGGATSFMGILDENIEHLHGVQLYTIFILGEYFRFLENSTRDHITHHAAFVGGGVRKVARQGQVQEIHLNHFSQTDEYISTYCKPDLLAVQVSPMDEDGYFYMGYNSMGHQTAANIAQRIVVQVNSKLPRILGECNKLHISRVNAIYEDDIPIRPVDPVVYNEEDRRAAQFIAERIPDGATVQIGVGRVPDAMTPFLMNHKHLGVHSEVLTQSLVDLYLAGVIDNSRKTLMPGKIVFSFADFTKATKEIYDFVDSNPVVEMQPISWVNDPRVIAMNDNMISVNSALSVDLTGQVCSEALGFTQFSGSGGQLDFVRGAGWSKGGRSFIVINSVAHTRSGETVSKIDLTLPYGSPVTTPRNDVDCIVTEYGVAELKYRSISDRTKALIAIAHPQFRDELTFKARKVGLML